MRFIKTERGFKITYGVNSETFFHFYFGLGFRFIFDIFNDESGTPRCMLSFSPLFFNAKLLVPCVLRPRVIDDIYDYRYGIGFHHGSLWFYLGKNRFKRVSFR